MQTEVRVLLAVQLVRMQQHLVAVLCAAKAAWLSQLRQVQVLRQTVTEQLPAHCQPQ